MLGTLVVNLDIVLRPLPGSQVNEIGDLIARRQQAVALPLWSLCCNRFTIPVELTYLQVAVS